MARLILDTSVLVAAERGRLPIDKMLDEEDDPGIAAITVAELLAGVLVDAERQAAQRARIEQLLSVLAIESYDVEVARVHADLMIAARRPGRPRGAHDLIIAATARATGRTVVTLDRAGFDDLPGVAVRVPA